MKSDTHVVGASAARNKVANALAEIGLEFPRSEYPPGDEEFQNAALAWKYGGTGLAYVFEWNQATFEFQVSGEILQGLRRGERKAFPLFSAVHRTGSARNPHRFQLRLDDRGEPALFDGMLRIDFEAREI